MSALAAACAALAVLVVLLPVRRAPARCRTLLTAPPAARTRAAPGKRAMDRRWIGPLLSVRARRHREIRLRAAAPDVIDLFRVAAAAGLSVRLAVDAVCGRVEGEPAEVLGEVRRRVLLGDRLSFALASGQGRAGALRPLLAVLEHAERDGVVLGPSLERVSRDARLARRRAAEEHARRAPVRLLFPLVFCVLPAFVLLTVVPLLAGSFGTLTG